jgi:acetyl-CoA acetyltransferase
MAAAYIVGAVRSAGGRNKGRLSRMHPADLGGKVLDALVERTGVDPAAIDDVVFGCVMQSRAQAGNVARNCVLSSRLP